MKLVFKKKYNLIILLLDVIIFCNSKYVHAEDNDDNANKQVSTSGNFFYYGQDYGSESQFGPLNVFINVGFMFTASGLFNDPRLNKIDYQQHSEDLYYSIFEPNYDEGYHSTGGFIFIEFFPVLSVVSYPNYVLHFIGEGMLYRKLDEYFIYQGYSSTASKWLAGITITSSQLMNEFIEARHTPRGDAQADMVFNAMGIFAFSFDGFAGLFSNDNLKLLYWPGQPIIDVRDTALYNHSETYLFRITMGDWTNSKIGVLVGAPASGLGISLPSYYFGIDKAKNDFFSIFLIGTQKVVPSYNIQAEPIERLRYVVEEDSNIEETSDNEESTGEAGLRLAWDKYGSLMSYLQFTARDVNPESNWSVTMNWYPSFLRIGSTSFGAFIHYGHKAESAFAITINHSLAPGYRFRSPNNY